MSSGGIASMTAWFRWKLAVEAAGPRDTYTLTYRTESPAITYSVTFTGPPEIARNIGGGRYEVRVPMRGFKD